MQMKTAWWLFGASSTLFVILALLVSFNVTTSFDQFVLLEINRQATATLDQLFIAVTQLGGVIFITLASLLLLMISLVRKKYDQSMLVVIGMGGMIILNLVLKALFERTRPDLWEWIVTETSYSFPSGHATASMALAFCFVVITWRTKWRVAAVSFAGLYVLCVGFSRMYLGVHFPTDILGGWLLGLAWLSLVSIVIYSFRRKALVRERLDV